MMNWYYYIALIAIISQLFFLVAMTMNYHFALGKYRKKRSWTRVRVVLIVPCKGLDPNFQKNIASFFNQDYKDYLLWFVVAEKSDPAYDVLCKLKQQLSPTSEAQDVQVMVAGAVTPPKKPDNARPSEQTSNAVAQVQACSQKIHNLLYCYEKIGGDIDVLAFADSDICVRSDWLKHLVWPLRKSKNGAASGYRWFVPKKNNPASLALSAMNAKVAQFLGKSHFNQAWGGSMAIRVEVFRKVGLDKIWPKALSDDYSLTYAVKKARLNVTFVPACLVASYESTTWPGLFEFGRRQFLITRVSRPWTWLFGLGSSLYAVLGLWAGAALALYAATIGDKNLPLFVTVPIAFFLCQLTRAILRQKMAGKLLKYEQQTTPSEQRAIRAACAADILGFWLWSLMLLFLIISSAFGRTICWRGIRYKLLGPDETIVVGPKQQ